MFTLAQVLSCSDTQKSQDLASIANEMTAEEFLSLPSDYHRHIVTAYSHTPFRQSLSAKLPLDRMNINKASIFLQESEIGVSTMANRDIKQGENVLTLRGPLLSKANVFTIQVDNGKHMVPCGGCEYLAHSCQPNVKLVIEKKDEAIADEETPAFDAERSLPDLTASKATPVWWNDAERSDASGDAEAFNFQDTYAIHVVAIRDIKRGDVVSFNYLTTEYDMDAPFPCLCQGASPACDGPDGLPACFGKIQGYKHLTPRLQEALKPLCTSIVLECHENGKE